MSLITQCPACTTLFKVVPDQLRISEGWVRCGQCDEVFDANAHLQSLEVAQTSSNDQYKQPSADESPPQDIPTPSSVLELAVASTSDHAGEVFNTTDGVLALHVDDPMASDEDVIEGTSEVGASGEPVPKTEPDATSALSFMKKTSKGVVRRSSLAVVLWSFCLFLLAALLCLQLVVHERDRLAAMEPRLNPLLLPLCDLLECKLAPLRQIESVVIENSSFVNVRGGVYRLNATLKNTGPFEVAMPALELTLTDLQDQSVIRRVIAPYELGPTPHTLAAGAEFQATFPLSVKLPTGSEKFSGYRLVIFYL